MAELRYETRDPHVPPDGARAAVRLAGGSVRCVTASPVLCATARMREW
jgi:hypothetical protein